MPDRAGPLRHLVRPLGPDDANAVSLTWMVNPAGRDHLDATRFGGPSQNAEILTRFRAEARHAGSLSHPGIAQVCDYGEADHAHPPFLVMELVDGPSLAGLLAGRPLDPVRAMDVVAQQPPACTPRTLRRRLIPRR
jgi:serine/threonine protein kinase